MSHNLIIPKRSEVDPAYTWSSEDLYATDADWKEAFRRIKGQEETIAAYQGRLAESGQILYQYFQEKESMEEIVSRLYTYASIKSDEDTTNSLYQGLKGQLTGWLVLLQQAAAFEVPELIAISTETVEKFMEERPELRKYERYLEQKRRRKAHILSQPEETLLAAAGEIADAPDEIYGNFSNADLKFPSVQDVDGNHYPLTNGSYISLLEQPHGPLRKAAFENLYGTYEKFKNTTAAMLNAQVKQSIFFARARKYTSTLEAALDQTEVPTQVYDNLIQAVHDNLDKMYRYMAIRKKAMEVESLHMYDLYTSIVSDVEKKIPFDQAREEIVQAMSVLGEEYSAVLKRSFEERWMDIYENEGKRSGAYSSGSRVHPFILLNHKDNLNSEFTLAHELGHAMHSYFSNKNQPMVYSNYVIFVAEVASICNEALLMQYLLQKTEDKKQRAYLINYFLEQFRTTLYRQTMFAEFEKKIHAMAEDGEALTADRLKKVYYDLNCLYYGEEVVIDPFIAVEWARIPHFYYNFYVYQYATGFAAAMALSQRILKEGQPAVEDYLKFLSAGSGADPITLLKMAGVDMTTEEPVNQALHYFGQLLDEMEALIEG